MIANLCNGLRRRNIEGAIQYKLIVVVLLISLKIGCFTKCFQNTLSRRLHAALIYTLAKLPKKKGKML